MRRTEDEGSSKLTCKVSIEENCRQYPSIRLLVEQITIV